MAQEERIYRVVNKVSKIATLVWAPNRAQAIRHATRGTFDATVATQAEMEEYMRDTKGAPIEHASAEPPELNDAVRT